MRVCRLLQLSIMAASLLAGVGLQAQMVTGRDVAGYGEALGLTATREARDYTAQFAGSGAPGNVLWPGEQTDFSFQLTNASANALAFQGKVEVIAYGTRGRPGDIWLPEMVKLGDFGSVPLSVNLAPGGFQDCTVRPAVPARLGAYALVVDLGPHGRRFVTSFVRTFKPARTEVVFPQFALEVTDLAVLTRLGSFPNRHAIGYKPTTDNDFESWFAEQGAKLAAYRKANLPIILEIGAGAPNGVYQPLGRPRPWLDPKDLMMGGKCDWTWLPSYDDDFRKFVKLFVSQYGWPRGPINGIKLWNEPWEGISISGWGADMPRYREIFRALCEATDEARTEGGLQVLIGGCDSSSNTFDKLFGDGKDDFLRYLDFCSIHYQGMSVPTTVKAWADRKGARGRVRVWDTESWVANVDDRVAAVLATNLSIGQDRVVAIYGGNVCTEPRATGVDLMAPGGGRKHLEVTQTWSVAAAVGAANHFLGQRRFRELLFKNGLPWVMVFDGLPDADGAANPEDGTVVVVGDIGEEFGSDCVLFRTARGFKERAHKAELRRQLAALPAGADPRRREELEVALRKEEALSGASMTLRPDGARFSLFDFYGNPVPAQDRGLVVPLDHRGFFLRSDGKPGSFAALLAALRAAGIEGIEPLAPVCHDLTAPLPSHPNLRLTLTNVLNRPVSGKLGLKLGDLSLEAPPTLTFKPHETKEVLARVVGGDPVPSNTYRLSLVFDAGRDGKVEHEEDLHVNLIAKRTITVDGRLQDWEGVLPQPITAPDVAVPTLTEAAWFPFRTFDASVSPGFATGYLAYDERYFYFAAKIADDTPEEGMVRFETRDDDEYYYPEKCYDSTKGTTEFSVRWTGQVQPEFSETYTFVTVSANGVRVAVNGQELIDNWTDHGATEDRGTVALEAGKRYDIKVEYHQNGRGAAMELYWQSPHQRREIIPATALFATAEAAGPGGLTGQYHAGQHLSAPRLTRVDPTLNFAWRPREVPDERIKADGVEELLWPAGVRRFSYRTQPELPAGNCPEHDNVQIAFNALPADQKPWYPCPPGTMPGYIGYYDTDYEYALNPVAPKYGGGTEIWRLRYPGMPHKHFYPRQGRSPFDGPVRDGKLVVRREGNTRLVEAALPWTEIPAVKQRLDAGQTIKFSFRVNDNAGGGCMELSRGRSVAKRNGSFMVDWMEHWANELEFAAER